MGVTDQHGREWEGLGKVVAAAGTPKLPREVSPSPPTLGCDLLQHEVIEVLLGNGALDTERTVTNSTASLQPAGHNIYNLFPSPFSSSLLPFAISFSPCVPALPFE